jgi:transcriptional regulator with XRE-family HTH domain
MLVGQKIRKLRELRNYTQEYMATQLGLSQKAYCNIETNQTKISLDRFAQIAQILAVDAEKLFSFDEDTAINNIINNKLKECTEFVINQNTSEKENELLRETVKKQDVEIVFLRSIIEKLQIQNPPVQ